MLLSVHLNKHNLLVADKDPAAFWITNPFNHFYNNRAAGARFGCVDKRKMQILIQNAMLKLKFKFLIIIRCVYRKYSFWYAMPFHPLGFGAKLEIRNSFYEIFQLFEVKSVLSISTSL